MDSEELLAELERLQEILSQAERRLDQAEQFGIGGEAFDSLGAGARRLNELHAKWEGLPARADHMRAAFDGHLLESTKTQVDEAYYEVRRARGVVDADLFTVKRLIEQAEYDEPIWKEIKEALSFLEPEMEEAKSVIAAAQQAQYIDAQETDQALRAMENSCPLIPEVAALSGLLADRDDGQDDEAAVVARARLRQIEGDIPRFRHIITQLRELVQREGAPAEDAQGE